VNDAPVAKAQAVVVPTDSAKGITLTGSDVDGDPLIYSIATAPRHGTLSGTPPELTYLPVAGYSGLDAFVFVANDGAVDSAPATINLLVGQLTSVLICSGRLPAIGTSWAFTCTVHSGAEAP
jgi:hypothetical protein